MCDNHAKCMILGRSAIKNPMAYLIRGSPLNLASCYLDEHIELLLMYSSKTVDIVNVMLHLFSILYLFSLIIVQSLSK